MAKIQVEDIDQNITDGMRLHIADLVMRWANFETAVTYWVVLSFGMPMDASSIMLGRMDTRNKLDKLHELHKHFGHPGTDAINRLRNQCKKYTEARNIVAHQRCAGFMKSSPDVMVFHSIRHIIGVRNEFEIIGLPLDVMGQSALWAEKAEQTVRNITDGMTGPLQ